ncbi:MAG: hypothetical protein E1N59_1622 [Puniceicoccaceae bacterium 5H]|nr:MAG: hypothetical protein E1N59_1622 [Puniceicoccaceae bacterium 5H]
MSDERLPSIEIHFCPGCRWWLRAGYTAQELFATFGYEIGEIRLIPGPKGIYVIKVNGETIWDRHVDGGFPEIPDLKRRFRDLTDPARELGHLEKPQQD